MRSGRTATTRSSLSFGQEDEQDAGAGAGDGGDGGGGGGEPLRGAAADSSPVVSAVGSVPFVTI
jgi:hypothetical protein